MLTDGRRIPVTVVEAGPCVVIQKKTKEKDGYSAIQVGFLPKEAAKATGAIVGHCKTAGSGVFSFLRELRMDNADAFNVGDVINADVFAPGDLIDVTGTSIGKGFQGVIKRWASKAAGLVMVRVFIALLGLIGCSATPSRVFKNKKMPGQLGNERVTVQRLKIVRVDAADNLILVCGAIPGATNGLVVIKDSVKAKK